MKAVDSLAHELLSGDAWAIVKRAGVYMSHTGSGTGGGSTKAIKGEGRMSSRSIIRR